MSSSSKKVIVVCGPTAVGKTAVSIALAKALQSHIINADSRQIYAELNIGVAKPSLQELNSVPHHLIGTVSINRLYGAGDFEKDALALVESLHLKSNIVIVCGGTGMYLKAFCEGLDPLPKADEEYRQFLNEAYKREGVHFLQQELDSKDPSAKIHLDYENPQRLMRALEIIKATGQPYAQQLLGKKQQRPFEVIKIGLNMPREQLYLRINQRVNDMMHQGLLDEVKGLSAYKHNNALKTVGYKELFSYLEGQMELAQAVDKIKQHTRNYAKRQLTWFNADKEITWYEPAQLDKLISFVRSKIN